MSTIYPLSWFILADEAESDPVHSTVCAAAGAPNGDAEVSVWEVGHDDAEEALHHAGKALPPADEPEEGVRTDRFFLVVGGAEAGYGRLVHLSADGKALRV